MSGIRFMLYPTIVADPPWPYPDDARGWGISIGKQNWREGKGRRKTPYPSMTTDAIKALPVRSIAEEDAHLYLWATNRHLHEAFHVAEEWGFRHAQTLVWAKPPRGGFLGGAYGANVEFVLFCRRGTLATKARMTTSWFDWPRNGVGSHSRKPEGFLDIVEAVSPGPYLEMFARRARLGWDTWGDEALGGTEALSQQASCNCGEGERCSDPACRGAYYDEIERVREATPTNAELRKHVVADSQVTK